MSKDPPLGDWKVLEPHPEPVERPVPKEYPTRSEGFTWPVGENWSPEDRQRFVDEWVCDEGCAPFWKAGTACQHGWADKAPSCTRCDDVGCKLCEAAAEAVATVTPTVAERFSLALAREAPALKRLLAGEDRALRDEIEQLRFVNERLTFRGQQLLAENEKLRARLAHVEALLAFYERGGEAK